MSRFAGIALSALALLGGVNAESFFTETFDKTWKDRWVVSDWINPTAPLEIGNTLLVNGMPMPRKMPEFKPHKMLVSMRSRQNYPNPFQMKERI